MYFIKINEYNIIKVTMLSLTIATYTSIMKIILPYYVSINYYLNWLEIFFAMTSRDTKEFAFSIVCIARFYINKFMDDVNKSPFYENKPV